MSDRVRALSDAMTAERSIASVPHYVLLTAILCVGAFLRLTGLRQQSLWFDEADIVVRAQRPLRDVLTTFVAEGENGPLYNIMLALWVRVAGISEIAVRFPSAIAGILAIPLIYLLGRRLIGPNAGLFAAGLLAISPYHVWYSQEAKMYAIVVLLALASTFALTEAQRRNTWPWWAGYTIVTTLLFYTHVATVLVFVAQVLWVLVTRDDWEGRWKGLLLSAGALTLPYIPIAAWALKVVGGGVATWQPDVGILEAFKIFGVKFAVNRADADLEARAAILFALLAIAGCAWLLKAHDRRSAGLLLTALTLVPIIGLYLVSLRNSVFSDRYIIVALPAYLLLVAAALTGLLRSRRLWPAGILLATLAVASAWAPLQEVNRSEGAEKEDWRSAYADVARRAEPGDVILLHPGYIATTLTYYEQREPALQQYQVTSIPTFRVNWLTEEIMIDLLRIDVAPATRFWLVQSPDRVPPEDPDDTLETWLDRTGERLYHHEVTGVEVTLYQLPERWWE